MQRQETLQDFIEPVVKLNEALKSAAFHADNMAVARHLAQGADIAYALKGYVKASNTKALNRLLAMAKYILYCQFRRDMRGLANHIHDVLTTISFTLPANMDSLLEASGIHYPDGYYQGVAGLVRYSQDNDPALNTVNVFSILEYLFSSMAGGLLASKTDTMIYDLFEKRCFENPLMAMQFFSHINDAEQRLEFYAAAAFICQQQGRHYFFNRTDKSEFLVRAATINRLMRGYQFSFELAYIVANESGVIAWLQAMVKKGSFACLAPRDIGRIVTDYVVGQSMLRQLDHQLDSYTPAPSAAASAGVWANHFSSLAGRLFGFYISPAAADAARPEVGESIRPWGGY